MTAVKTEIGAETPAQRAPHTPTITIPKSNVWAAIKHVYDTVTASVAAHLADTTDAHDAAAISSVAAGDLGATNVQDALDELDTEKAGLALLASTANGEGASLIGIEDAAGNFTAANAEGALAEVLSNLASNNNALGASLVGIEDSGGLITATDVEAALAENRTAIDQLESDVSALGTPVQIKGTWDASMGSFPGAGAAQAGWSYIVSVGGTVDSVVFVANDRILAITDNASATTFAANWHKLDYTDQVLSVDGQTGAVDLSAVYQPLDADLTTWAGLTPSANAQSLVTAANYAAMRTLLDLAHAVAAGVNTGTATNTVITPDALAGSNYGVAVVEIQCFQNDATVVVGNDAANGYWRVPSQLNGWNLVGVAAHVGTAGTTGSTTIQVHNVTQAADMLSTNMAIETGETDTLTSATPGTIDTNNDGVATGDKIRIDVDAVSTTEPLGLVVTLQFQLP